MATPRERLNELRRRKRIRELKAKRGTTPEAPIQEEPNTFVEGLRKAADVSQKLFKASPPGIMLEGANKLNQAADFAGEKVAEGLGSQGVNPYVSAGLGILTSLAPEALIGGKGAGPLVKGLRRTTLGAIKPAVAKAGVLAARTKAGLKNTLETIQEPRTRKQILAFTKKHEQLLSKSAKNLSNASPETLFDLRTRIGRILDSQNVAKFGKDPKTLVSKDTLAKISKFKGELDKALTKAVPSLQEPTAQAAAAFRKEKLLKSLGKGGGKALRIGTGVGTTGIGLAALIALLKG